MKSVKACRRNFWETCFEKSNSQKQPDIMRERDYYFMKWQFCISIFLENENDSNHDPILRLWGIDLQSLQWHVLYKCSKP